MPKQFAQSHSPNPTANINQRFPAQVIDDQGGDMWTKTRPVPINVFIGKQLKDFNWPSLEYQKDFYGINLSNLVAYKMRDKLYGKGLHVYSKDDDIQALLEKHIIPLKLYEFCMEVEPVISVWGGAIVFIDYIDGKLRWEIVNPWITNINTFEQEAYYTKFIINLSKDVMQSVTYTYTKMEVKYIVSNTLPASAREQLIRDYKLKDYTKPLNVGQIPVFFFLNHPKYKMYGNVLSQRVPDMINIAGYQAFMDQLCQTAFYELQVNKTRAFALLNNTQIRQLQQKPEDFLKAFFSGITATAANTKIDGTPGSQPDWLKVVLSTPTFEPLLKAINDLIKMTMAGVGLSEGAETGVQQSMLEVDYINQSDAETVARRKNWRRRQLNELIVNSLMMVDPTLDRKKLKDEIKIEVRDNLGVNQRRKLDENILKLNANLITRVRALMDVEDLTEAEAKARIAEVDKELQKEATEFPGMMPGAAPMGRKVESRQVNLQSPGSERVA